MCAWMRSKSSGAFQDHPDRRLEVRRRVVGEAGRPERLAARSTTCSPGIRESPLANVVTWWPRRSSSWTSSATIRSVPPYAMGGTASSGGATWAIRSGRRGIRAAAAHRRTMTSSGPSLRRTSALVRPRQRWSRRSHDGVADPQAPDDDLGDVLRQVRLLEGQLAERARRRAARASCRMSISGAPAAQACGEQATG